MVVKDTLSKKTGMLEINFKKILINFGIISVIFLADRLTKIYILKIAEVKNTVDIYVNTYLNFYLIWNKGIAFGLFSFNERFIYNIITAIILLITVIILIMIIKNKGFKKYSLMFVLGGSLGNLFDRIYYSAVPDFIDFHINDFHWFVFNVADIFITLGIICLIFDEILINDKKNGKNI
jgi:signal peptidase II